MFLLVIDLGIFEVKTILKVNQLPRIKIRGL